MSAVLATPRAPRRASRPLVRTSPLDALISTCESEAFRALMIGASCEMADRGTEAGQLQAIHDLLATAVAKARAVKGRLAGDAS